MNAFIFPKKFLAIFILAVSCYIDSPLKAQIIQINNTFISDEMIFPFETNEPINGLSISGSVNLLSNTSLVRVLLMDNSGIEWMVYEAYPMIVKDSVFEIIEECDETCFLNECVPISLSIQLIDAEISISYLSYSKVWHENLSTLQRQAKNNKDLIKVQSINHYITSKGWEWIADTTGLVKMYFQEKVQRFHDKYDLLGRDYYSGGFYYSILHDSIPRYTESTIISSFDWREKHNADLGSSPYFEYDGEDSTNGWMTGIRDQKTCGNCSAFASITSLEAAINLYANYQFDVVEETRFSEKDAFNCSKFYCEGNNEHIGCDCNNPKGISTIMNKLRDEGVVNESCFPYETPYCLGCADSCEQFQSKCTDPMMTAQIWAYRTHNLI
jgi:hypothetical protein